MSSKVEAGVCTRQVLTHKIGFYSWDLTQDRLSGDPVLAEIYGIDAELMDQGVPVMEIFERIHTAERPSIAKAAHDAVLTGGHYQVSYRVVRPDASVLPVVEIGRCFQYQDGVPTLCAGMVFPTTAQAAGVDFYDADNIIVLRGGVGG